MRTVSCDLKRFQLYETSNNSVFLPRTSKILTKRWKDTHKAMELPFKAENVLGVFLDLIVQAQTNPGRKKSQ